MIKPVEDPEMRDPRNDEDYDTWDVGMEPIPGDKTWTKIGELSRKLEAGTRKGSVLGSGLAGVRF